MKKMSSSKTKRIVCAVVAVILVLAMVVPMALSAMV